MRIPAASVFLYISIISSGSSGRLPTLFRHAELLTWFSTRILVLKVVLHTGQTPESSTRLLHSVLYPCTLWACAANARSEANFLLQTLQTQALLNAAANVLFIARKCTDVHCLSPSFLVPHHANPKGSFQVGWWRTRQ